MSCFGEAVLVEDDGRTILRAGDCAAWPKGGTNGHHLINESDPTAPSSCIGGGKNEGGGYSDIDMKWTTEGSSSTRTAHPTRVQAVGLGGLPRLVLLDHPGLVLRLVDPFGDVRVRQDVFHIDAGEVRHGTP